MEFHPTPPRPLLKHLRVRVENCVSTILELHERIGDGYIRQDIIRQFELIRDSLRHVTDDNVDEADISRIEEATNQLLAELRTALPQNAIPFPPEFFMH